MNYRRTFIALSAIALLATISFAGYALTASSTVPANKAGEGSGSVTTYAVSNIDYTLNTTTAYNIDQVTFTLTPAPPASGSARIKYNGQAYSCTLAGANATCATTSPQAVVTAVPTLSVIAAD